MNFFFVRVVFVVFSRLLCAQINSFVVEGVLLISFEPVFRVSVSPLPHFYSHIFLYE